VSKLYNVVLVTQVSKLRLEVSYGLLVCCRNTMVAMELFMLAGIMQRSPSLFFSQMGPTMSPACPWYGPLTTLYFQILLSSLVKLKCLETTAVLGRYRRQSENVFASKTFTRCCLWSVTFTIVSNPCFFLHVKVFCSYVS
jgi:hypothetical protein